jgi:menaquinone-dependent protoporphyrinogen oxidase
VARYALVYASSEGHTKSVVERLAADVAAEHHDVDVVDHRAATAAAAALQASDAVVLAGSVHMGRIHRGLARFAARRAEALAARPSALVVVCLTATKPGAEAESTMRGYVDAFLASTTWRPDVVEFVAGALRPARLGPLQRAIIAIVARQDGLTVPPGGVEFTDWEALDRFGRTVSAWFPRVGVITRAPGPTGRA